MIYVFRSPHPRGGGVFASGNTKEEALKRYLHEAYTGLDQIKAEHVRVCTIEGDEYKVCSFSGSITSDGEIKVLDQYTEEQWFEAVRECMLSSFEHMQTLLQSDYFKVPDKMYEHAESIESWINALEYKA